MSKDIEIPLLVQKFQQFYKFLDFSWVDYSKKKKINIKVVLLPQLIIPALNLMHEKIRRSAKAGGGVIKGLFMTKGNRFVLN